MTLLDVSSPIEFRDRILSEAYELFGRVGFEGTTFEDVAAASGVSVAEIRLRFPDESVLLVAAIEHASLQWAAEIGEAVFRTGATTPEAQVLALFTVYEEWFGREDFDAITLMRILSEAGKARRSGMRMLVHVERVRTMLATLAAEAGFDDPDDFALSCHVLLKAAIISAIEGDTDAIVRAERMARGLIEHHRHTGAAPEDTVELAPGADSSEWLVVSELARKRGEAALAIIRLESGGYHCYPHVVGYGRLGPYATLEEARAAVLARVAPHADA